MIFIKPVTSLASALALWLMMAGCQKAAEVPAEMVPPLTACLGSPLPETLVVDQRLSHVDVEDHPEMHRPRVGIGGKLARADFKRCFKFAEWTETPLSKDDLSIFHLPAGVPKSYLICYLGSIDGRKAKVFWFDSDETFALLVP